MNPVIRRRLPQSVRTLLTDIGPKEEWTDTEPDTVTRDGILLPSRGAAPGQEEFLTPAKTQEEEATEDGSNSRGRAVCMLCKCKPSCYTCPRCNLHYCGLACYQSPDHRVCSEEFYKESVLQELKDMGKTESEGRKKMQEILEEEVSNMEREDSQTMDGQDGDNKVKTSQEVVQNQEETATKLKKSKGGKRKETNKGKGSSSVPGIPPVSAKIPKLSSLCANPSPLICYGLVNTLFAYTFTLCLFNNDTDALMFELCDMILALAEALSSNKVFSSVQEALDCGETLILNGGYLDKEDPLSPARAVEAVAHIMTGKDRKDATGYCLAALSQLRSVLSQARTSLSKEGEEGARRQKYFLASKKCEFFQAWVLDNEHRIRRLAIELWNEHSKRESLRSSMEKAKTVVEESLKKGKRKGKSKLIEELDE